MSMGQQACARANTDPALNYDIGAHCYSGIQLGDRVNDGGGMNQRQYQVRFSVLVAVLGEILKTESGRPPGSRPPESAVCSRIVSVLPLVHS